MQNLIEGPALKKNNIFPYSKYQRGHLQLSSDGLVFAPDIGDSITIPIGEIKSVIMTTPMKVKTSNGKYYFDLTFATAPSYRGAQFALSGSEGAAGQAMLEKMAHLDAWVKSFKSLGIKTHDHTLVRMTPWATLLILAGAFGFIAAWFLIGLAVTHLVHH